MAFKAEHHQYNQHFISDHKGAYTQFKSGDIFDTAAVDRIRASYQRLRMGRMDIVERYITHLKSLYMGHFIWQRAEKLARKTLRLIQKAIRTNTFKN